MQLKKIKLAGFKSFVDPTVIEFNTSLIAIVGPNGCGKSNVIDAVRWVMGESSAKHLRGDAMTDVIFNGSSNRKPVGQASVELVFDNQLGRLVGEYAAYSEIAIKRVVTREGVSQYYLNGSRCRRKDVVDIFLGTGLGPRSYSIISQGTVSRLIEARPEELRAFIEEAAGVSKYKERRRETENRIRHTKENLERVEDICNELDKQLDKLQRQAKNAEKYKLLKDSENQLKVQLAAVKLNSFESQSNTLHEALRDFELRSEAEQAQKREIEADIEKIRLTIHDLDIELEQAQEQYFKQGSIIAKLEQTLNFDKQKKNTLEQNFEEAKAQWMHSSSKIEELEQKIETLSEKVVTLEPELEQLLQQKLGLEENLNEAKAGQEKWRHTWDEFIDQSSEHSERAHQSQAAIQTLEASLDTNKQRVEKLQSEKQSIDIQTPEQNLSEVALAIDMLTEKKAELSEKKATFSDDIRDLQDKEQALKDSLDEHKNIGHQLSAQLTSLQALQESALGKDDEALSSWLVRHGLATSKRLAEMIQVKAGYEQAIETALKPFMQAVFCQLPEKAAIKELDKVNLSLMFPSEAPATSAKPDSLSQWVSTDITAAKQFLVPYRFCQDMETALSQLNMLDAGECWVCADGTLVGNGYIQLSADKDIEQGVLAREKSIEQTNKKYQQNKTILSEKSAELSDCQQNLEQLLALKEEVQQQLMDTDKELSQQEAKKQVLLERIANFKRRLTILETEIEECEAKIFDAKEQLIEQRDIWQQSVQLVENNAQKREDLQQERDRLNEAYNQAKLIFDEMHGQVHEKQLVLQAQQTELGFLKQSIENEQERSSNSVEKVEQLKTQLLEINDEHLQRQGEHLDSEIEKHQVIEQKNTELKQRLNQQKALLAENEHSRTESEQQLGKFSSEQEALRLEKQSLMVRIQTIHEQLAEADEQALKLAQSQVIEQQLTESSVEEELEKCAIQISRLGAINLAAIEEYDHESERKQYLDEQHQDLTDALATLEAAINKIDNETKNRFNDTYQQVNNSFSQLFPRLFGGGQAYLSLTSQDLLETGVEVMARPPGKKNSTIHLLSGGEKAMTAVALVLAIFQLNPSPFCMLDEVDAPLDDANVSRFCAMVKEMSEHVQFIFITHNKVTMELASHLSGVTMHEPGVSRIVSVDVQEAMAMAE